MLNFVTCTYPLFCSVLFSSVRFSSLKNTLHYPSPMNDNPQTEDWHLQESAALTSSLQFHVAHAVNNCLKALNSDSAAKASLSFSPPSSQDSETPHLIDTSVEYKVPPETLKAITSFVKSYTTTVLPSELRHFSAHGRRQAVNADDVMMMVRKLTDSQSCDARKSLKARKQILQTIDDSSKRKKEAKSKGNLKKNSSTRFPSTDDSESSSDDDDISTILARRREADTANLLIKSQQSQKTGGQDEAIERRINKC